ncbi:MAG TPA: T9SS type A sorting domain-containing protein [Gemmatimonadota bacterium]|nr:T9SS type A sorting domain-containing protein [Gemmatimonadota bacterium]
MPRLTVSIVVLGALASLPATALGQREISPSVASLAAHDVNDVFLRVTNRGSYGLRLNETTPPGNFPRGTANRYLFGAGLWIGGIGDVDANGVPDTITTIGYNPQSTSENEYIEGVVGQSPNDPRFRVLDTTVASDQEIFPDEPIAAQELFTVFDDRFSVGPIARPSIPLGVEVRQRSFAFTEPDLDTAVVFQWDILNISGRIRETGYTIRDMWTGLVLDPDIGEPTDDTAAPLEIDGEPVLLVWDFDFEEEAFTGRPGFLALVPLDNPGAEINMTQLSGDGRPGVQPVPQTDSSQYEALTGIRIPTFASPFFDLRVLIGMGGADLPQDEVARAAMAWVWAEAVGEVPEQLLPSSPELAADAPFLTDLVAAVRAVREAYDERIAGLPVLLDFPAGPAEPGPGNLNVVLQNYPNPFTDETTIEYSIVAGGDVSLQVFDAMGQVVTRLAAGHREPATYTVAWNGRSLNGREVPSGVYVIRLTTSQGTSVVRALKLR